MILHYSIMNIADAGDSLVQSPSDAAEVDLGEFADVFSTQTFR